MTTATARPDIDTVLLPALDNYSAALAAHTSAPGDGCACGWTTARPNARHPRRALGLHISAAHKAAARVYDAQADDLLRAAGIIR